MADAPLNTQEQMYMALMKNEICLAFIKTLYRIDSRLDRMEQKVNSHFHWTLGLIFGMYAIGLTGLIGALGHAYGWF